MIENIERLWTSASVERALEKATEMVAELEDNETLESVTVYAVEMTRTYAGDTGVTAYEAAVKFARRV